MNALQQTWHRLLACDGRRKSVFGSGSSLGFRHEAIHGDAGARCSTRVTSKCLTHSATKWLIAVLVLGGNLIGNEPPNNSNAVKLTSLQVEPSTIALRSARDQQAVVVTATFSDGSTQDVTSLATATMDAKDGSKRIVDYVNESFIPKGDGRASATFTYAGLDCKTDIRVTGSTEQPPIGFRNEVLPSLTRAGCNTGKCHGSASGKDGFRLSLFGYDPVGDQFRLTREQTGRRVHLADPTNSLVVLKATGTVPHTGGGRIAEGSRAYESLVQWLHEGAKPDVKGANVPIGIDVFPKKSVFSKPEGQQKLVVMARYSDGTERDVTPLAVFLSNNDSAASVSEDGLVDARGPGAAFILARFDQFTQGASIMVRPEQAFEYPQRPVYGEIDKLVDSRLKFMHLAPSELAEDEQFLRRISIDLVGLLPTTDEYQQFMQDKSGNKRERLVDRLLERPEVQDIWVMKWAELLQIRTNNGVSQKALRLYDRWLREAVHSGLTIDKIVQKVLPASGGSLENPATNYYQTETTPQLLAENVAQVFLGTRIQCAQCHNHPFDRWTMDDYYGFASFFSQVGYKQAEDPRELTIYNAAEGEMLHPLGSRRVDPKFLGAELPKLESGKDYRQLLAEWIASNENTAFSKNIANIVWAHFFGIGIVDPVDDMRVSNPPSNPELLAYLGEKVIENGFEIKKLMREICLSRTYQTSTRRNDSNQWDEREFTHQKIRRMRAEVLLDCISQATETTDRLPGLPKGSRAVQVADGLAAHYFLTTFGRSTRATPCTCEVKTSPTLSQALHLLNGETTGGKIKEGNLVGRLLDSGSSSEEVARELYVRCLTRQPTDSELKSIYHKLSDYPNPRDGLEDLYWAILNSNEFVFNH